MIQLSAIQPSRIQVVTFDCYGTLIDWETGIWSAFRRAAEDDGVRLDRSDVIAAYHAIEPMVESEPYRTYREVLIETARRVAAECGWSIGRERAAFLPRSLPEWPAFPDTRRGLSRIATGRRLGILSNVDEDLLAESVRPFGVDFDFRVTADRVKSYKPDLAHFEAARPFVGKCGGWLHAAQSLFHDVAPARCIGVPVAWVNRQAQRRSKEDPRPDLEFPDLASLADWLESG